MASDLINPRDPDEVSISLMDKFVASYARKVTCEHLYKFVMSSTIMCTREGEAVFESMTPEKKLGSSLLLRMNLKALSRILTNYNMNLSLVRSEIEFLNDMPNTFLDPTMIESMSTGKFIYDPTFLLRLKNGITLVHDRSMVLKTGHVTRNRRQLMKRAMPL